MKYVYEALMILGIFGVSLFFFGSNMKEVSFSDNIETVEMREAEFPMVKILSKEYTMNVLHGYNNNLDANLMRESMTPIGNNKTFQLRIEENGLIIKKINYQLHDVSDNRLLETGEILALDENKIGKEANITLDTLMNQGKEYAFKLIATTDNGKKIHYYTRLKYYVDECYLKEKMDFIEKIHKVSFQKSQAKEVSKYFEVDGSSSNDSFAKVDIHSSEELFTWGNLKPQVLTKVIPTIKEFNIETAAVQLDYYVKANPGSGDELYLVKEFYRIRYTKGGSYQLLKYDRTMEAVFDLKKTSVAKNELKMGITQKKDIDYAMNKENTKMSYVRERALWFYNIAENSAIKVFSYLNDNGDYEKSGYDQHDIRILGMDEDGNIDFMVFGYMNRGDYEGSVGIVLYRYYSNEKRVEEQVFIPLETTYQMLKEDLDSFSYVNKKNNFYFSINNVIYNYNITAKKLNIVAVNIKSENFYSAKESSYIVWQDAKNVKDAKEFHILDLEEEKERIVKAKNGQIVKIIGMIDQNMIYGFGKTSDLSVGKDGNDMIPLYRLEISDSQGNVLKQYQEKNIYIVSAKVENNIVNLERVKRKRTENGTVFEKTSPDSILNKDNSQEDKIRLTKRVTKRALTEYYLTLPGNNVLLAEPEENKSLFTVITENRTLRLNLKENKLEKYYVYAQGGILQSYTKPSSAILSADEAMGVVISNNSQIVWERGGKYRNNTIGGLSKVKSDIGISSTTACIQMLLKQNNIQIPAKELEGQSKSAYKILRENLKEKAMNLTGCNLDEVLYYVSGGRGVFAMKDGKQAVVLTGYNEVTVTMYDPDTGKDIQMSLEKADKMFKDAGYVFFSYLP